MKKMILAIPAAAPAIPPKPNIAAMIAMIKKPIAQLNISFSLFMFYNVDIYGKIPSLKCALNMSGIFLLCIAEIMPTDSIER